MKRYDKIVENAKKVIEIEGAAIANLSNYIDYHFVKALRAIQYSKGRVIVSGVGKSAIIGQKIVATFNSTGTPAVFMHATDAVHGDLGNIQKEDVVLCMSNGGNSPEIKALVPLIKSYGNKVIGMTSNKDSFLAKNADFLLYAPVDQEACPNNLAPTTSTTVQLVMGDALAICLIKRTSFTKSDFAKYHPGGSLGKKMYLKIGDLVVNNEVPAVQPETPVNEVIIEISKKRLGATAVLDNNKIAGIITDGDLRRMIEKTKDFSNLAAKDIMNSQPKMLNSKTLATTALKQMAENGIKQLLVTDNKNYIGMVHMQDLAKEGIF